MSKSGLNKKIDVCVIGAGVAGAVAASVLAKSGLKVAIIDKTGGATSQSSGAIDVANTMPAARIAQMHRLHPYAIVGEQGLGLISEALAVLRELAQDVALFAREDGRNILLATQLGTLKQSAMVQGTQSFDLNELSNGDSIALVGFSGLPSFDARSVARMLTWSLAKTQCKSVLVQPLQVALPPSVKSWRSCMEMALAFDEFEISSLILQEIQKSVLHEDAKFQAVLLPPVLGCRYYRRSWHALNESGENRFFELLAMPHSAPGYRLKDALFRGLNKSSIDVIQGEVVRVEVNEGIVEKILVDQAGEVAEITAKAVVLSTGRFLAGGFQREGVRREKIFGLPLWDDGKAIENAHVLTLSNNSMAKEQAIFNAGLSVDEKLRPHNRHLELFALNLFAAGSSLGGYDSGGMESGLGVAALTGLVCGYHACDYVVS